MDDAKGYTHDELETIRIHQSYYHFIASNAPKCWGSPWVRPEFPYNIEFRAENFQLSQAMAWFFL